MIDNKEKIVFSEMTKEHQEIIKGSDGKKLEYFIHDVTEDWQSLEYALDVRMPSYCYRQKE